MTTAVLQGAPPEIRGGGLPSVPLRQVTQTPLVFIQNTFLVFRALGKAFERSDGERMDPHSTAETGGRVSRLQEPSSQNQ